jgi:RNA polymerase sigma-70 factor (ECF subfamily)
MMGGGGARRPAADFPVAMTDDGQDDFDTTDSTDARWAKLGADIARAVRRQCPWWLSEQAQDIAQAALIKVMTSAKNREGDRVLSSFYLYRLAHSAVVDEIRRRRRRREVTLEVVTETGEDGAPVEPDNRRDPERRATLQELGAAVRDCLVAMKRERRLAVMLHLQEHSVPEAARILGWTVKRTENLVYRGLANLRDCLRGKGHGL